MENLLSLCNFQVFDIEAAADHTDMLCTKTKLLEGPAKTPYKLFEFCGSILQEAVALKALIDDLPADDRKEKLLKRIAVGGRLPIIFQSHPKTSTRLLIPLLSLPLMYPR